MKSIKIMSYAFLASILFLMGLCLTYSEAQPPFIPPEKPFPQTNLKGACRIDPSITFTEKQTERLTSLQQAYIEEMRPLWNELRDLRFELRFWESDPRAQSQVLLDKQRMMSSIQARLENLRFSYLIKTRSIFTKEQIERFPPDCPLKMGTGYGAGRGLGKGLQKGKPW